MRKRVMFGRNGGAKASVANAASSVRSKVSGAADPVVGYIDPLARDEQLRRRLLAAIAAGAAAGQRARSQTGLRGLASRLASDRMLHAQLAEAVVELQSAQRRARRVHSHRLRNTVFLLGSAGLAVALIATRDEWLRLVRERGDTSGSSNAASAGAPASAGTTAVTDTPLATAGQQASTGTGESSNTDS